MARDVRKFVQSFNMSRQFAQEQCTEQTLDPLLEQIDHHFDSSNDKKRRTDWSEYIDPEDDHDNQIEEEQGEVFEQKFVTELPKALFKRPKLNKYSTGIDAKDGEELFKPVFSKRSSNKHISSRESSRNCQPHTIKGASKWSDYKMPDEEGVSVDAGPRRCKPMTSKGAFKWSAYTTQDNDGDCADKEPRICQPTMTKGASKWSDRMTQDNNGDLAGKVPWTSRPTMVKGASKWNDYIADDDDDLQFKNKRDVAGDVGEWDHGVLETALNDQMVEEDIHPDFR
ncbi:uncharacterized protein LOC132273336 [Cornus florida]|uniref:uncharacterized protein LOC132273336 n=1 Tax=Cornus florida TaxID=4283 RepID=UPI00289BFA27|nr:uncharacterized protein LOC132273336 [Cornus florida]